jgi:hypothetical protein
LNELYCLHLFWGIIHNPNDVYSLYGTRIIKGCFITCIIKSCSIAVVRMRRRKFPFFNWELSKAVMNRNSRCSI